MKSPTAVLTFATILFITVLGSVIPHDTASSSDNASPLLYSLLHPLSLLYPRARANDGEQDVHTIATAFCKRCSEAYVGCANVSLDLIYGGGVEGLCVLMLTTELQTCSQCEIICQGVHVDGKLCKKECGWTQ